MTILLANSSEMKSYLLKILFFIIIINLLVLSVNKQIFSSEHTTFKDKLDNASAFNFFQKGQTKLNDAKYDSVFYYFNKAADIFKANENWEMYLECQIQISYYYFQVREKDKALQIITTAESFAKNNFKMDHILFSSIFHRKGSILIGLGDYMKSINLLTQSIDIRVAKNGKSDSLLAPTYNSLGLNYFYLGQFDIALKHYKNALKIAEVTSTHPSKGLANYNQAIGIIYSIKGEVKQAFTHYKKSLEINEQILSKDNPGLALTYENFGAFNSQIGQYNTALNYLNKAEKIYKVKFGNEYYKLGTLYLNKGNIYSIQSEFKKALNYYKKSLKLFQLQYAEDHTEILTLYYNIGLLYYRQFNYMKALEYFQKSLNSNASSITRIKAIRNLANCNLKLDDKDNAKINYLLAIEACEEFYGEEHTQLALCFLDYGDYNLETGDYKNSLEYYSKALKIYIDVLGQNNIDVSDSYHRIAKCYMRIKDFPTSLIYHQKSLIAISNNFSSTNIYENPDIEQGIFDFNLLQVLQNKAQTLFEYYTNESKKLEHLNASYKTYQLAIDLINKMRGQYYSEQSKLFFTAIVKETYSNAINVNLELFNKTSDEKYRANAFVLSEKSKSAVFMSSIKDLQAKDIANIPKFVLKMESDLKGDIKAYEKLVNDENQKNAPNLRKIKLWEDKLFVLENNSEKLVKMIEQKYPEYYKLKFDNSVIDISEIQSNLKSEQVLIEYTLSQDNLFIFVILSDDYKIYNIKIDDKFHNYIDTLRKMLTNKKVEGSASLACKQFVNSSYNLYCSLIKPFENLIKGKDLIIIPDDKLGYIPFDILLTKAPTSTKPDFAKLNYLIKENSISYSYLATLLFSQPKNKKKTTGNLLAFAPTYENAKEVGAKFYSGYRSNFADYLVPLPGAVNEVQRISDLISGDVFYNYDATEEKFKAMVSNYKILHLAMHTIINDNDPMNSQLVFTLDEKSKNEGLLHTYEIYNLDLNADMVVLSACNTGTGKLEKGEGIMSLARGFIYAGYPSIIMTLWRADDKSGADLMTSFYNYLNEGKSKDEALRHAKLDYLKSADKLRAHPYFWAGYVSIGDSSKIKTESSFFTLRAIVLILLIVVVLTTIGVIVKRKFARN